MQNLKVLNTNSLTKVPETQRLTMLPKYFGNKQMMRIESSIYRTFANMCEDYRGGYWDFYEIPNGFYMAPSSDTEFSLSIAGNYFDEELSPDAAGIVVCLFVYCHFANKLKDDRFSDLYHALREFSLNHAEKPAIFRAID